MLQRLLETEYDVSAVSAPPYAVLWAAEKVAQVAGPDEARRQLRAANRLRERHGRPLVYATWGHPAF